MHSATQSSGKSTGNKKKRIHPAIPEEITIKFSLSRTDFFDEGIAVLEEFDNADWMTWK